MAKPSRALIGWTAGAALASSQVFGQHVPDRLTIRHALRDGRTDDDGITVADVRSGYIPSVLTGAAIGGFARLFTGSWWPLAASALADAVTIALYENALPAELRLDPARALIAGFRASAGDAVDVAQLPRAPRARVYEADWRARP